MLGEDGTQSQYMCNVVGGGRCIYKAHFRRYHKWLKTAATEVHMFAEVT